MLSYDLIVIGTGPAGQRAAIQGAKMGKRVAVIERREVLGGVCVNTGTIPSKTFREAVVYFSGHYYQNGYGVNSRAEEKITIAELVGARPPRGPYGSGRDPRPVGAQSTSS